MIKGYRFRLHLNPEQAHLASRYAGICRFVYNEALAFRKQAWEERQERVGWLDLDKAFQNFFRRCRNGETPGYPRFKKNGVHDAFRFPQGIVLCPDINTKWGQAKLPKLGIVKFRKTQNIQGALQNATVSRHAGRWYISFSCKDVPVTPRIEASKSVGIDRGIAVFAALSDGTLVKGPEPGRKAARRLAKLQRNLSRKETYHAVVAVEELKVRNMTLHRAILDQGWFAFETMLAYNLAWRAGELVKVKAAYTSQTCSVCGDCRAENRITQEAFRCRLCGHEAHADLNAARNILAAGHVVKACGGTPIGAPTNSRRARCGKSARRDLCRSRRGNSRFTAITDEAAAKNQIPDQITEWTPKNGLLFPKWEHAIFESV